MNENDEYETDDDSVPPLEYIPENESDDDSIPPLERIPEFENNENNYAMQKLLMTETTSIQVQPIPKQDIDYRPEVVIAIPRDSQGRNFVFL